MLELVATCGLGVEELLAAEVAGLGAGDAAREPGAVSFRGSWEDCWRANWRLRTANRVLVAIASWDAPDGEALAAGARAVAAGTAGGGGSELADLLHPSRSLAVRASASTSQVRDPQWAALKVKDGLVDGQRRRWGRRSDVDRARPDLALRVRLHRDRATLLLDTSGEPLDRRGYRAVSTAAPVRETLAAACVLAAGWDGRGPVVDPMCGSGTLLVEAGWLALGRPPGALRAEAGGGWAFERLPGFDAAAFAAMRREELPAPGADILRLTGRDRSAEAVRAACANLARAGLAERAEVSQGDAFEIEPPEGPGLLVVNPPYGERVGGDAEQWRRLGDLLKRGFRGWRAAVLAGGPGLGKGIGLKPRRRVPVWNGPLEARILVFDLY
ncbi:MAG TPA: RNA methyltransferase, partial [Thermoanaerobaculia bacterium]|nr:RNA methyltransferase [Thermoanaerobaculia bacterium]